jgi:thioredoxin-related protein
VLKINLLVNILILLLSLSPAKAKYKSGKKATLKIKWIGIEEALKKQKNKKKPIFVDVYTDWCKYCKVMDTTTYRNKEIITYLNKNFYAAKMNPEKKGSLVYEGKRYSLHQFSIAAGVNGFPALMFFDTGGKFIYTLPGYHPPDRIIKVLKYFKGELYNKQVSFEDYIYGKREPK